MVIYAHGKAQRRRKITELELRPAYVGQAFSAGLPGFTQIDLTWNWRFGELARKIHRGASPATTITFLNILGASIFSS